MFKKAILAITTMSLIALCGCNPSNEQIKIIAKQAGLFSAVGWIAIDNPDCETKSEIISIIDVIENSSGNVQSGQSYADVLYPVVDSYINEHLDDRYQPLAKAASISILGGLDILFAANPEWVSNQDIVLDVVSSFCSGAKIGLAMNDCEPVVQAAVRTANRRMSLTQKK